MAQRNAVRIQPRNPLARNIAASAPRTRIIYCESRRNNRQQTSPSPSLVTFGIRQTWHMVVAEQAQRIPRFGIRARFAYPIFSEPTVRESFYRFSPSTPSNRMTAKGGMKQRTCCLLRLRMVAVQIRPPVKRSSLLNTARPPFPSPPLGVETRAQLFSWASFSERDRLHGDEKKLGNELKGEGFSRHIWAYGPNTIPDHTQHAEPRTSS